MKKLIASLILLSLALQGCAVGVGGKFPLVHFFGYPQDTSPQSQVTFGKWYFFAAILLMLVGIGVGVWFITQGGRFIGVLILELSVGIGGAVLLSMYLVNHILWVVGGFALFGVVLMIRYWKMIVAWWKKPFNVQPDNSKLVIEPPPSVPPTV